MAAEPFTQEQLAGVKRPPGKSLREFEVGELVLCRGIDNSRNIFQVTSKGPGTLAGRKVSNEAGKFRVEKLRDVLCRTGEPEPAPGRWIHGDLLYWPSRRSGFQYSQIVSTKSGGTAICRWNEAKWSWTKPAPIEFDEVQYWGHVSEPEVFERFIARIKLDMELWEQASGRSYWNADGRWVQFARRWNIGDASPSYTQAPPAR